MPNLSLFGRVWEVQQRVRLGNKKFDHEEWDGCAKDERMSSSARKVHNLESLAYKRKS